MKLLPGVHKASNTLQTVMGIDFGSKLLGQSAVRVWEMPQKPISWMDMVKQLHAGEQSNREREERTLAEHAVQGTIPTVKIRRAGALGSSHAPREQSRVGNTPRRPLTRPMRNLDESPVRLAVRDIGLSDTFIINSGVERQHETVGSGKEEVQGQKRKLQESPGLRPSPTIDTLPPTKVARPAKETEKEECQDLPQIIVTDADDPSEYHEVFKPPRPSARAAPPPPHTKTPLFPPIPASTMPPASPPFNFAKLLEPSKQERLPIYWDWLLSRRLCEWLDTGSTRSTQTELTHLELRSSDSTTSSLRYEAKDFEKLKLTRLTIATDAETERSRNPAIAGASEQREWFVVEVQHKNIVLANMEMDEDGMPLEEPEQDPEDFPEDYWLLALPLCSVTDTKSTAMDLGEGQGILQTTVWRVGLEGLVPSMHGRGVDERFAEDFVKACAAAKGVIEFACIY